MASIQYLHFDHHSSGGACGFSKVGIDGKHYETRTFMELPNAKRARAFKKNGAYGHLIQLLKSHELERVD